MLRTIQENGLSQNTLVMFSSDNGPWYQGSAGNLRGRKGSTYEGGVREPFIARFPGRIPAGLVSSGVASTLDILPTLARLCNAPLPAKPLDGIDIWPLLAGKADSVDREALLYFDDWQMQCARLGKWKLHVARYNCDAWVPSPPGGRINLPLAHPELYDIEDDPKESYDVAANYPEVVAQNPGSHRLSAPNLSPCGAVVLAANDEHPRVGHSSRRRAGGGYAVAQACSAHQSDEWR